MRLFILIVLSAILSTATAWADTESPQHQAQRIAEASPQVSAHLLELKQEAGKIEDKSLRESALEFLTTPKFQLSGRLEDEAQIRKALLKRGLLNQKTAPSRLIPTHSPMPFVAAPASIWMQHHTYPGGLVFHTLTNLGSAIALGKNWEHVNGIHLRYDWLRAAPIWHDIAKTWVIEWNADGTATSSEGQISGTGSHHILGIAEALMRGLPPAFIVVLASAHQPAHPGPELHELIRFLEAAAIIAGKPFSAAGLNSSGTALADPAPLESYLHHLSDHDWVASEVSLKEAVGGLNAVFPQIDAWKQDELLARYGDLRIAEVLRNSGTKGLRELFTP